MFSVQCHELIETRFSIFSSGTSAGEPKLIPSIAEDLDRRTFFYNLIMPIMNQYTLHPFPFSCSFLFCFPVILYCVCDCVDMLWFMHVCLLVGLCNGLIPSRNGFFNFYSWCGFYHFVIEKILYHILFKVSFIISSLSGRSFGFSILSKV